MKTQLRTARTLAVLGGSPAFSNPILLGRPRLPSEATFRKHLAPVFRSRWLTNDGALVRRLEDRLRLRLGVGFCAAFCNGTTALQVALRSLNVSGEVTLVEAYAACNRPDVRCVIAGSTRGELAGVKRRISAHGLHHGRVALLGEIDDQDVPALYASAACFVYPSRYEGFGLQAIEAMAMGVPVIASDGGALPEVVGDAGLIFPVGDAQALAGRLAMLFDDANLLARLVRRGRTRAEDFRWQKVIPNYLDLYQHL